MGVDDPVDFPVKRQKIFDANQVSEMICMASDFEDDDLKPPQTTSIKRD